ncbi:hypothetical protein BD414DRAFT_500211 [Trametes punicea]|nr:hypothetical protein BD414DRAFT_500211 [Trametes punicea]
MEVLSRPQAPSRRTLELINGASRPGTPMFAAPSPDIRSNPRLPSPDHRLKVATPPTIATRRSSTTVGSLSPSHLSRPLRSSPLAGPSIAVTNDGTLISPVSAPPTPGGGGRHLSPLAEFPSTTELETHSVIEGQLSSKKQRRRTLGAVFSKLSFPAPPGDSNNDAPSPSSPATPIRRRTKSTASDENPPVPPLPSQAAKSTPAHVRAPGYGPATSSSSRAHATCLEPKSKPSRPTSPTPSTRSAASSIGPTASARRMSFRPPPNLSTNPESNWLTQAAPPRFSRLGLKAEGVVLPISVREARRRSMASSASRTRSFDTLSPPPMSARSPSRSSAMVSHSHSAPSTLASPSTASAGQQRFLRSRASSRASLASAVSGLSGLSVECDTPSLTMSPGPSTTDVSVTFSTADTEVDEMGVLVSGGARGRVEFQLNDLPVGALALPAQAYTGKGKERTVDFAVAVHETEASAFAPWTRVPLPASPTPSTRSSAATSVVDLSAGAARRASTAPERGFVGANAEGEGAKAKRTHALGRVWKHVVRSVTAKR